LIWRNDRAAAARHDIAMWPYYPELLARPVPRYTSFPTAADFGESVGAEVQSDCLQSARGDVSLYVHIPYCSQLCWYCGCNTGAVGKAGRLASYLTALEHEIDRVAQMLSSDAQPKRIAFGGGSPNAISPIAFVRILTLLTTQLNVARPLMSIEIDPRDFSDAWADTVGAVGISHVSLGVQTFDPDIQAAIGRIQPTELVERTVTQLRKAGVSSLNFDLMYGLPGQTHAQLDDSLARTIGLGADRVALFGYAHVPHLIARQRRIDASSLPDQAARFAMASLGYQRLTAAGYVPVGFDHFARPNDPLARAARDGLVRRNFQGFTEDQSETLIGFGASAISHFPNAIIQNEKNAGRYRMRLSQDKLAGALGVRRSADDMARGRAIVDILSNRATNIKRWKTVEFLNQLAPFVYHGLIDLDDGCLRPTSATRPYARSIAALLDPYRSHAPQRFSTAV
jgi:oxygen-independent coproporphyrinogen-3 oxidase